MSYIGNPLTVSTYAIDTFSGNGAATTFTLSRAAAGGNSVIVVIFGAIQSPSSYAVLGTTLTFIQAPPAGIDNIEVRHLGQGAVGFVPANATVGPEKLSTGGPYWSTAGNFGIGTTSPAYKLHVAGLVKADNIKIGDADDGGIIEDAYNKWGIVGGRSLVFTEYDDAIGLVFKQTATAYTNLNSIHSLNGTLTLRTHTYNVDRSDIATTVNALTIQPDGNVGIGATSANKLTVNGNQVLLANGQLKFADATNNYIGVIRNSGASQTSQLEFLTGNVPTERMRITATGKIGIGTSTPTAALQVVVDTVTDGAVISHTSPGWIGLFPRLDEGSYNPLVQKNDQAIIFSAGTPPPLPNAGTIQPGSLFIGPWSTATTAGIKILANGFVGIGTSAPQTALDVVGTSPTDILHVRNGTTYFTVGVTADGASQLNAWQTNVGGKPLQLQTGGGPTQIGNTLLVGTADNPSMRRCVINGDLAATTSTYALGTTGWWGVNLNGTYGSIEISRNGSNVLAFFNSNNPNGTSGGAVGTVSITSTTTSYNTSSDYRLKENVQPMAGALATVAQLKPVTYTWRANGTNGQGFIAHELQEVVPDCVTGEKDAVDDNGNPVYQGVDVSFLVATLTAAIQELKAEVDSLKQQLATTTNK